MAEGVGTGIGIGIGEGLHGVAAGLRERFKNQAADREKQADALHTKGMQIAGKLLESGYTTKAQDGQHILVDRKTGQPAQNPPADISQMYNELLSTSKQATALFPPHEANALAQHFRKFLGKQQQPATPDPRAAQQTPESLASEAPGQQYTGTAAQFRQLSMMATDPSQPKEVQDAARSELKKLSEVQKKPAWTTYVSKDGKTTRRVDQNDPEDVAGAGEEGFQPYVAGLGGGAKLRPGTLGYFISTKYPDGATAEQQEEAKREWEAKIPQLGSEADFLRAEYGEKPTAEQRLAAHRLWTGQGADTVGTHVIEVPQPDGSIKAYRVTTTSQKSLPGLPAASAGPAATTSAPKTTERPSGAKPAATTTAKPKTPGIEELGTLGGRKTPAQTKAEEAWGESVKASKQADLAAKSQNSIEEKLLIESLVKDASGRFSTASYDKIVGGTGLKNKLEQLYNNVAAGGRLPDDVLKQAVKAAHDLQESSKAELDALEPPKDDLEQMLKDLQSLKPVK